MNQMLKNKVLMATINNELESLEEGLIGLNIAKHPNSFKDLFYSFKHLGNKVLLDNIDNQSEQAFLMSDLLIDAINNQYINICSYLLESPKLRIHPSLNDTSVWISAIQTGNLDLVKYLVNAPLGKDKGARIAKALPDAAKCKDLEILKYLIDDPIMPYHKEVMSVLKEEKSILNRFKIFVSACGENNKMWLDYLIEHKEYNQMINSIVFSKGLQFACFNGHVEMVKDLLTNKNLPYKPYVDFDPSILLAVSARNSVRNNAIDITQYLIFDLNIKQPDHLDEFFEVENIARQTNQKFHTSEISNFNSTVSTIKGMFEKRKTMENLVINLSEKEPRIKTKLKL